MNKDEFHSIVSTSMGVSLGILGNGAVFFLWAVLQEQPMTGATKVFGGICFVGVFWFLLWFNKKIKSYGQ